MTVVDNFATCVCKNNSLQDAAKANDRLKPEGTNLPSVSKFNHHSRAGQMSPYSIKFINMIHICVD